MILAHVEGRDIEERPWLLIIVSVQVRVVSSPLEYL